MRAFFGFLAIVAGALSLGAQDQPELLYTSTSGLRVEQNGTDFWVTFSDGQRVKLSVTLPDDPEETGNYRANSIFGGRRCTQANASRPFGSGTGHAASRAVFR